MVIRNLVLVLGDQLSRSASAWDGFDAAQDCAWMCEAVAESTHVWSTRQRTAVFLAAMRHFAAELRVDGIPLLYRELAEGSLADALLQTLGEHSVGAIVVTEPGEWRVLQDLRAAAATAGLPIDVRDDRHFLCTHGEFAAHAAAHGGLRMEVFYREMRVRHRVLLQAGDRPEGGRWNYDSENRHAFGAEGPGFLPAPLRFEPDGLTRDVIALVDERFAGHPGRLESFAWPVTATQARAALADFVEHRLASFGHWQDAMWPGEPWLYHSQLSLLLNLKLLDPRDVIAAAVAQWQARRAPLAAVEGFVRQILGWREYVRGVYWLHMPAYLEMNALGAHAPLPDWYWTGKVAMACLRDAITQTLQFGYAHHIQRLMVTGLYAQLLGVDPKQVHGWYLAVYVDAVEWVELPNTLGMSQYGDGGLMGSKPYIASGRYIQRMGGHCSGCRYDPGERSGDKACPFTTLYWDFLLRHAERFEQHPRLQHQVRSARAIAPEDKAALQQRAEWIRGNGGKPN